MRRSACKKDDNDSLGPPNYDELFKDAIICVVFNQRASKRELQKYLKIGYVRATRIMNQLETAGFVGPSINSNPRKVLVRTFEESYRVVRRISGHS